MGGEAGGTDLRSWGEHHSVRVCRGTGVGGGQLIRPFLKRGSIVVSEWLGSDQRRLGSGRRDGKARRDPGPGSHRHVSRDLPRSYGKRDGVQHAGGKELRCFLMVSIEYYIEYSCGYSRLLRARQTRNLLREHHLHPDPCIEGTSLPAPSLPLVPPDTHSPTLTSILRGGREGWEFGVDMGRRTPWSANTSIHHVKTPLSVTPHTTRPIS